MTCCQICPQLNAAQLKIRGHEIYDAIGLGKSWLASLRVFLMCLASPSLTGLSHLLDQADEHNHLVSAIETDLKSAAEQEQDQLKDLQMVIDTFSETKEDIIQAIAQYSDQTRSNKSTVVAQNSVPMSCDIN
nr:hypothetical protein [Leptolyngbyaceae cyanobacterium MAG.088]